MISAQSTAGSSFGSQHGTHWLQVDYTDSFRLFCTTRLPNPHYTPELSAKVTLVDFTVTMAGLEDQLLGKLILKEKHELEEQRQGLMEEVQSYKKKIKQLEDDLLFRLSNSQVSFLPRRI